MSDPNISVEELADLLVETGHHHHQAYISADGTDPEWALWYSGYLQTKLWNRAGKLPTRSLLIHLLISAEAEFAKLDTDDVWAKYYARRILDGLEN